MLRINRAHVDATHIELIGSRELIEDRIKHLRAADQLVRSKAAGLNHRATKHTKIAHDLGGVSSVPLRAQSSLRLLLRLQVSPVVQNFIVAFALDRHLALEKSLGAHDLFTTRDDVVEVGQVLAEDFGSTLRRALCGVDRFARQALQHIFCRRHAHRRNFRRFVTFRAETFACQHDTANLRVDEGRNLATAATDDVEVDLLGVEGRAIRKVAIAQPGGIALLAFFDHREHRASSKHINCHCCSPS